MLGYIVKIGQFYYQFINSLLLFKKFHRQYFVIYLSKIKFSLYFTATHTTGGSQYTANLIRF